VYQEVTDKLEIVRYKLRLVTVFVQHPSYKVTVTQISIMSGPGRECVFIRCL